MKPQHNPIWIILLVITILTFGLTVAVNYVLSTGMDVLGLNFTSQGDISDQYYTDITPASWAFSIWGVIYIWQGVWMIYAATLICRKSENGGNLYYDPPFFSSLIFVAYIFNLLCNMGWNFTWSLLHVHYALLFIALIGFFLYICIATSFYGIHTRGQELANRGQKKDVIMTIIFVQNGIGIYAAWVTIATLLNLTIVLHYYADVDLHDAGSITLGIIGFELLLWFVLDNFVFIRVCRFFFIPYLVLIYALAASVDKNWVSGSRNSIMSVVLIAVGFILLVVKIIISTVREIKSPLLVKQSNEKQMFSDIEK